MFEVRVEADFAAAHYLTEYHGKCENLHGHNYRVFAHVRGFELDAGGMLLDFGILKKALRIVCGELDHTNLNDMKEFSMNPSAERIAKYIYDKIIECLGAEQEKASWHVYAVDVYETPTSRARYISSAE